MADRLASSEQRFPPFDSETGRLMASLDASRTSLGAPAGWSECLKTAVALMLPAQAQMALFWGADYVALYNDAYAATIGDKHPRALGRPAVENWAELWDDFEPLLRGVRETGQTFFAKDRPFYMERRGYGETAHFDVSCSPVFEQNGAIGGVLCVVSETTERVRAERALRDSEARLRFLSELDEALRASFDAPLAMRTATQMLARRLGATRCAYADVEPTMTAS